MFEIVSSRFLHKLICWDCWTDGKTFFSLAATHVFWRLISLAVRKWEKKFSEFYFGTVTFQNCIFNCCSPYQLSEVEEKFQQCISLMNRGLWSLRLQFLKLQNSLCFLQRQKMSWKTKNLKIEEIVTPPTSPSGRVELKLLWSIIVCNLYYLSIVKRIWFWLM